MKTLQRFTLLVVICLTAVVSANSNHVRSAATMSTSASSHNQRRELGVSDWWYTLLNLLHAPCPSDHDHTLEPHGHCAHHSHHKPSSHHSSGGSSHSSTSGGSSGGSSVWNNDGHHDDDKWGDDGHAEWNNDGHDDDDKWGDDGHAEWNNDGHDDDDKWDDDGYHEDDKYSYWTGDAHDDDGSSSSHWWSQKTYATSGYNNADDNGSSSSMKSKLLWPLTILGALFVGLIALVVSRKRRRNQNNEVPGDVYVEHTDGRTIGTHDSVEYDDRSVKSSGSRKSLKSRVGSLAGSIKSKFSRKKSNNYDDAFDNDEEYEHDGGVYM